MDFFDQGPASPTAPPFLETIDDPEPNHPSPPRPSTLHPPPQTTQTSCSSPLGEDPSTETFPTNQTSTSLHDFRKHWSAEFGKVIDFPAFSALADKFACDGLNLAREIASQQRPRLAPRGPDRPSARPPIDRRRPSSYDPSAAKHLQNLYRVSKKRAAQTISGGDSPGFDGTLEEAFNYFTRSFGHRNCDLERLTEELQAFVPSATTDDNLFSPPTPEELSLKLRSLGNSAPGKDRIEYAFSTPNARSSHKCIATVFLTVTSLLSGKQPPS